MEKLIELLNQWYIERYKTNPNFVKFEDYGGNDYGFFHSPNDENLMIETEVWTKKYGFIKWLVDNDKIDTTNRFTLMANVENKENGLGYAHTFEGYEALIMILSIQDEPIDFLISVLK